MNSILINAYIILGVLGKDVDIATYWEGSFFTSTLFKLIYIIGMPIAYSVRPVLLTPKEMNKTEIINYTIVIITDTLLMYFCGYKAFIYLVLCLVLGHGLHPMSGHFIAEHCVFTPDQETYSYYGLLNIFAWNVGYHNEHHDFPRVAGWKLPLVTKAAPEFYTNLVSHSSWCYVLYRFITDPTVSPFNRMIRKSRYDIGDITASDDSGDDDSTATAVNGDRSLETIVANTHLKLN